MGLHTLPCASVRLLCRRRVSLISREYESHMAGPWSCLGRSIASASLIKIGCDAAYVYALRDRTSFDSHSSVWKDLFNAVRSCAWLSQFWLNARFC